jgi:hypothetical protein
MKRSIISAAILAAMGLGTATSASALTLDLCAGEFEITSQSIDGNTTPIKMWGYALGTMTAGASASGMVCVNKPTAPGPRITVPVGDPELVIHLHNALPRATSLIIPGTVKVGANAMTPVFFTDNKLNQRVRSFDKEVAPAGMETYSWSNLQPGSYMYQSGTHQQVQVQMGLAGPATKDFAAGQAYAGANSVYAQDTLLIYSEIDRVIHDGVAAGQYNESDMQSTVHYAPKYFNLTIVNNGATGSALFNDVLVWKMPPSQRPLVRMFNASSKIHVPTVLEAGFDVIAEDGKQYPNVHKEYAVALPPLKTKDAFLNITGEGFAFGPFFPPVGSSFRLTDAAMSVSNPIPATGAVLALAEHHEIANGSDNGMVVHIEIEPQPGYSSTTPLTDATMIARRDEAQVDEGGMVNINVVGNDLNATGAVLTVTSAPKHAESYTINGGTISYQHDATEAGRDSLIYTLTKGTEVSSAAVVIAVNSSNDAPIANPDSATVKVGQTVEIRVTDNDTDADSRELKVLSVDASGLSNAQLVSFVDKAITVTGVTAGDAETMSYVVSDGDGGLATGQLTLSVVDATSGTGGIYGSGNNGSGTGTGTTGSKPETNEDKFEVHEHGIYSTVGNKILGVLANDIENGGKVSPTLAIYPEHGSVEMFEDGTFVYTHDGSESSEDGFTYEVYNDFGSTKGEVEIKILPKMDPPRTNNDKARTNVDTPVTIDILRNDKDKDSNKRAATIVIDVSSVSPGAKVEVVNQRVVYTPAPGFSGRDSFKYSLKDDKTGEASHRSARVSVKVKSHHKHDD